MQELEPDVFSEVRFTPPTMLIQDKFVIDGGDLTLELLPTPGHTDDHYSVFIPEIATLLAADAAELPYPMARTPDGLPPMRESLAKLAALPAETVLYCHAPVTSGRQLLLDNIAYFNAIEAAVPRGPGAGHRPQFGEDVDVIALVECRGKRPCPTPPSGITSTIITKRAATPARFWPCCNGWRKRKDRMLVCLMSLVEK
jgi:glyoxylase-like metal-dependent hydrolase (beta-lactamase superfamily II)